MVYPAGGSATFRTHARHLELADRVKPEEDAEHEPGEVDEDAPKPTEDTEDTT